MNKLEQRIDRLLPVILPIAFIGAVYLSIVAFVVDGHRHEWFRVLLSIGVQAVSALIFFSKVILLYSREARFRKPILFCACIPGAFALVHLWALAVSAEPMGVLKSAIINGCYLVSSCCAFIIIAVENRVRSFLVSCRIYALVVSPVILYYCIRFYLPSAAYGVADLGIISYMSLAYMLLNFCIFLLLEILLYGDDSREAEKRHLRSQWVNIILYLLFAAAIALSGTKGTMVCLLIGGFLTFFYALYQKKNRLAIGFLFAAGSLCVFLFATVLYPNYGVESRVVSFFKETSENSVNITAEDIQKIQDIIQQGEGTPGSSLDDNIAPSVSDYVKSGKATAAYNEGRISEEEYNSLEDMAKTLKTSSTGGRKYLWTCALEEIKSAPLIGHGPFSYQYKYGTYPHNLFLEIAADMGLPIMLLILALGIFIFIKLFLLSLRNIYLGAFTLYVLTYLFQKMISGSVYNSDVFFQYGFCILIVLLSPRYLHQREKAKVVKEHEIP